MDSKKKKRIFKTASQLNRARPGTLQTQEMETKSNGLGKDTEIIAPTQKRAQT